MELSRTGGIYGDVEDASGSTDSTFRTFWLSSRVWIIVRTSPPSSSNQENMSYRPSTVS